MDMISLREKLQEIRKELQRLELWQEHMPFWVNQFEAFRDADNANFQEWLQHVYLPNKFFQKGASPESFIAPQAIASLENVPDSARLIQLLIELDALI